MIVSIPSTKVPAGTPKVQAAVLICKKQSAITSSLVEPIYTISMPNAINLYTRLTWNKLERSTKRGNRGTMDLTMAWDIPWGAPMLLDLWLFSTQTSSDRPSKFTNLTIPSSGLLAPMYIKIYSGHPLHSLVQDCLLLPSQLDQRWHESFLLHWRPRRNRPHHRHSFLVR